MSVSLENFSFHVRIRLVSYIHKYRGYKSRQIAFRTSAIIRTTLPDCNGSYYKFLISTVLLYAGEFNFEGSCPIRSPHVHVLPSLSAYYQLLSITENSTEGLYRRQK